MFSFDAFTVVNFLDANMRLNAVSVHFLPSNIQFLGDAKIYFSCSVYSKNHMFYRKVNFIEREFSYLPSIYAALTNVLKKEKHNKNVSSNLLVI